MEREGDEEGDGEIIVVQHEFGRHFGDSVRFGLLWRCGVREGVGGIVRVYGVGVRFVLKLCRVLEEDKKGGPNFPPIDRFVMRSIFASDHPRQQPKFETKEERGITRELQNAILYLASSLLPLSSQRDFLARLFQRSFRRRFLG